MAETNGFLGATYARDILNGLTGRSSASYIFSGSCYLGLLTGKPTYNTTTGYNVSDLEVVSGDNGYQRQVLGIYNQSETICFGNPVINEDGTVTITNTQQIKFNKALSQWKDKNDNATFTWFVAMSSKTGGSLLFAAPLSTAITVEKDQAVNIAAGEAKITINTSLSASI